MARKVVVSEDIQNLYDRLNAILNRHGDQTISVPVLSGQQIKSATIIPLVDKLNQMSGDMFYRLVNQDNWGTVASGYIIKDLNYTGLENTIQRINDQVICKNVATYQNGGCVVSQNSKTGNNVDSDSYSCSQAQQTVTGAAMWKFATCSVHGNDGHPFIAERSNNSVSYSNCTNCTNTCNDCNYTCPNGQIIDISYSRRIIG